MQPHQQPIQQQPRTDVQYQQQPAGGQFRQQATPGQFQGVAGGRQQVGGVEQFEQPSGGVQAAPTAAGSPEWGVAGGFQGGYTQMASTPAYAGHQQVGAGQFGAAGFAGATDPSIGTTGIQRPSYAQQAPATIEGRLGASKQPLAGVPQTGYVAGTQFQPVGQAPPVKGQMGAGIQEPAAGKIPQQPSLQGGVQQPGMAQRIPQQAPQGVPLGTLASGGVQQQSPVAAGVPEQLQSPAPRGVQQQSLTPQGSQGKQLSGQPIPEGSTLAQPAVQQPEPRQQSAAGAIPAYGGMQQALTGQEMLGASSWAANPQSPVGYGEQRFQDPSLEATAPLKGSEIPGATTAATLGTQRQGAIAGQGVPTGGSMADVGASGVVTEQASHRQTDPSLGARQGMQFSGTPPVQR